MTMAVVVDDTGGDPEPVIEPVVAMEIGEIAGKLDAVLEAVSDVGECDHAEVLAQIAAIDAKLDAFIASQAAPVVAEPVVEDEPIADDTTIVAPEPEPLPPEHPFFKKVIGDV